MTCIYFFEWFRNTRTQNDKLEFYGKSFHAIFGYFQIDKICDGSRVPKWMSYHPHAGNTIHIAKNKLSWDDRLPGAGKFKFDDNLILTKNGLSRSKWDLLDFFKHAYISHHNKDSWKEEGYFQSAPIGQEFVISYNEAEPNWISLSERSIEI